jgi:exopolysaccharide production protein ExoQ
MPASLAIVIWLIFLVALLYWDPAKNSETSFALWVPVMWMFIVGSRLPSQWLGGDMGQAADTLEEGNPLDRTIYLVLILLAVGILVFRSFKWENFFTRNVALTAFLSFALISACWSDFPFIALKRWFRDLGNYLVILVALCDRNPAEAACVLLRRLCYLLVPLSILLIKYYPNLAISYSFYSGAPEYMGATTSKNMLGVLCLVCGTFLFWDTVTRWSDRKKSRTRRVIVVNIAFMAATFWLLRLSHSATSSVCLVIACLVIVATHSTWIKHHPAFLKAMAPTSICLYLVLSYGFGVTSDLTSQVGRDSTFTGRTEIWKAVLSTNTDWLVGTGYESFWIGPRLSTLWPVIGPVNEAHSGYLEIYLNLGAAGVVLSCIFLIASYRTICRELSRSFSIASLALALWTIMFFYNVTESAAFRGHFLWVAFVLVAIVVSTYAPPARNVPAKTSSLKDSSLETWEGMTVGQNPISSASWQECDLAHSRDWMPSERSGRR